MHRHHAASPRGRRPEPDQTMTDDNMQPLSDAELAAEAGTALPDKEVVSILDLNADLDLDLSVNAPVDLAVAANANVAAPIDAAVSGNILSSGSTARCARRPGRDHRPGHHRRRLAPPRPRTASIDNETAARHGAPHGADTAGDGTAVRRPPTARRRRPARPARHTPRPRSPGATGAVGDTVGGTAGTVGDTVDGTAGTVGDTVGGVGGTVGDTVGGVTDTRRRHRRRRGRRRAPAPSATPWTCDRHGRRHRRTASAAPSAA